MQTASSARARLDQLPSREGKSGETFAIEALAEGLVAADRAHDVIPGVVGIRVLGPDGGTVDSEPMARGFAEQAQRYLLPPVGREVERLVRGVPDPSDEGPVRAAYAEEGLSPALRVGSVPDLIGAFRAFFLAQSYRDPRLVANPNRGHGTTNGCPEPPPVSNGAAPAAPAAGSGR